MSNEELLERLALLKEINALMAELPEEDEMRDARDHLATLHAIKEMVTEWMLNEDDVKEAADHLATLEAIKEADSLSTDEVEEAAEHLDTLRH